MKRLRPRVDGEETATDATAEVGHTTAPSDVLTVRTQAALGCTQQSTSYTYIRQRWIFVLVINTAHDSGESFQPATARR